MATSLLDISDPARIIQLGVTRLYAGRLMQVLAVSPADNALYILARDGLKVFYSWPKVRMTMRMHDAPPGVYSLEASLGLDTDWQTVTTTNVAVPPLEFIDSDLSGPRKFYRVRQH